MMKITKSSGRASRRGLTFGRGLAAACLLALASTASAQTALTPSSLIGDASTQGSNTGNGAGITNPNGSATQYLATTESTANDGGTVSTNPSTSAVPVSSLAKSSYLNPSTLSYNNNSGTEGSGFLFTLNVTSAANSQVRFTYNFATSELTDGTGNPDFAFYSLTLVDNNGNALANPTFARLGSAADGAGSFSPINDPLGLNPFTSTEGYKSTTTATLANGRYVLAIGVVDTNSFAIQSGVYIGSVTQVPEPGTTAALLLGGLSVGAVALRRRQRAA